MKVYCYSKYEFDRLMEDQGLKECPNPNIFTISIQNYEENLLRNTHYFKKDIKSGVYNNYNLNIDDCSPFWWGDSDFYDKSLELYKNGKVKESNSYFCHLYKTKMNVIQNTDPSMLHILDYEDAFYLAKLIDDIMNNGNIDIYVHCEAGVSRSQSVVRYILDVYGKEKHIETREENPCITPNSHVLMMLKRAYYNLK